MKLAIAKLFAGLSLVAMTSLAYANTTHESFIDVAGSVSFDGWNELNRNRTGGALTEAQLVAGTGSNVAGSGDAVLTRTSGTIYPAGAGLYGSGAFTFTDSTIASGITSLAFQGIINDFTSMGMPGTPFSVSTISLYLNGSTEALTPVVVNSVYTGGASDYFYYSWDLSSYTDLISSYTISMTVPYSQILALQIDQVAAVPEPGSYAMLLVGLGLMGVVARRRNRA